MITFVDDSGKFLTNFKTNKTTKIRIIKNLPYSRYLSQNK